MPRRCCHGSCWPCSDERYPDRLHGGVFFIPFPKPKTNLEKCLRWIQLCRGRPQYLLNVDKITKDTYVCSKHFKHDRGPTEEFPDPIEADPCLIEAGTLRKPNKGTKKRKQRKKVSQRGIEKDESVRQKTGIKEQEIVTLKQEAVTGEEAIPVKLFRNEAFHKLNPASSTMETVIQTKCLSFDSNSSEPSVEEESLDNRFGEVKHSLGHEGMKTEIGEETCNASSSSLSSHEKFENIEIKLEKDEDTNMLMNAPKIKNDEVGSVDELNNIDVKLERDEEFGVETCETESAELVHRNCMEFDMEDCKLNYVSKVCIEAGQQDDSPDHECLEANVEKEKAISIPDCTVMKDSIPDYAMTKVSIKDCAVTKDSIPDCAMTKDSILDFAVTKDLNTESSQNDGSALGAQVQGFQATSSAPQQEFTSHKEQQNTPTPTNMVYVCPVPPSIVSRLDDSTVTTRISNPSTINNINFVQLQPMPRTLSANNQVYKCSYCNEEFSHISNLKNHEMLHPNQKRHVCFICRRAFYRSSVLFRHMKSHIGSTSTSPEVSEKSYTCPVCSKSFTNVGSFRNHVRAHGPKRFECSICDKAFVKDSRLQAHMRTHTGEKPHQCPTCGKAFGAIESVKLHLKIHTGEKPFQCSICQAELRHRGAFKKHMTAHFREKPYQCPNCEEAFVDNMKLMRHMRTHTSEKLHQCSLCGKKLFTALGLNLHIQIHNGEKPHQCDVCGKAFLQRHKLNNHMKTHLASRERPYCCSVCGKSFCHKSSLKVHREKSHPGESSQ